MPGKAVFQKALPGASCAGKTSYCTKLYSGEGQVSDRSAARNFCLRLKGLSHTCLGVRSLTVLHSRARPPPILSEHDPGTAPTVSLLPSALLQAKTLPVPIQQLHGSLLWGFSLSRFRGRSVVTTPIRRSS